MSEFLTDDQRLKRKKEIDELVVQMMQLNGDAKLVKDAGSASKFDKIQFDNVALRMDQRDIISDSTFVITAGKRHGIFGRNGSGKSLFLKAIYNRKLPITDDIRIELVDCEMDALLCTAMECFDKHDPKEDILESLKAYRGYLSRGKHEKAALTKERMEKYNLTEETVWKRETVLHGFGFDDQTLPLKVVDLSGGWRMKIALSKVFISEPDILLLDDPGSMLDHSTKEWMKSYLMNFKNTLIFVSHDVNFINYLGEDILHFHNRKIENYEGKPSEFVMHLRTIQPKKEQWTITVGAKIKCTMIELIDMSFSHTPSKELFRDISLKVNSETRAVVMGQNGAGKTTLMNIMLKEKSPKNGDVFLHEKLRIGKFNQHFIDSMNMDLNAVENLRIHHSGIKDTSFELALSRYGIPEEDMTIPVKFLSGGQKCRVIFANMSLLRPNILILDEPTNFLDSDGAGALSDALVKFKGAVLVVTHDGRMMGNTCNQQWLIMEKNVDIGENVQPEELKEDKPKEDASKNKKSAKNNKGKKKK